MRQEAAERRADDEAEAEHRAHHSEVPGPALRRADVGHVGVRRSERGARHPRDRAPEEEPAQSRGGAHDEVIHAEGADGVEQHGAASKAVGEIAEDRGAEELHRGIEERQPAPVDRRAAHAGPGDADEEGRQHRDDEPEPDRVEEQGDRDEDDRLAAGPGGRHHLPRRVSTISSAISTMYSRPAASR